MNIGNAHRTKINIEVQHCETDENPEISSTKGNDQDEHQDIEPQDSDENNANQISINDVDEGNSKQIPRNGKNKADRSRRTYFRG